MDGEIIKPFNSIKVNTHYACTDGFPDRRKIDAVSMSAEDWKIVIAHAEKVQRQLAALTRQRDLAVEAMTQSLDYKMSVCAKGILKEALRQIKEVK